MLVSIQDLRSIQERCDVGELVQRLDVSIDRLTVIWDTDTGSLRRIFKNLKQAISTRVDSFEIHDNVRDDVFTLTKYFNEYDSINIIFFQLSTYGGEQLIRIDFNPNTLKEFDGMKVWRQLMYFARLNSLTVRLSRFDLAFDIFNRPEIVNLQHIKGGVTPQGMSSISTHVFWNVQLKFQMILVVVQLLPCQSSKRKPEISQLISQQTLSQSQMDKSSCKKTCLTQVFVQPLMRVLPYHV